MAEERNQNPERQPERGRQAETPQQIPKPGWKDIVKRTIKGLGQDHCTIVAAGVGFYILIGIVPGIAALISIYGLVANPAQIASIQRPGGLWRLSEPGRWHRLFA